MLTKSTENLQIFTLVNAARINPRGYSETFGNARFSCPTPMNLRPTIWMDQLYNAAVSHSQDMINNPGCFTHSDCKCVRGKACDAFSRIKRFYYSSNQYGENIAMNSKNIIESVASIKLLHNHSINVV